MRNLVRPFKHFCKLCHDFGLVTAYGVKIAPKLYGSQLPKHRAIISYLERNYKGLIDEYQRKAFKDVKEEKIPDDCPIWVCWFQGEEQMPPIIRGCLMTIRKHCGSHEVKLITMDNLKEWLSVPVHILSKVKSGKITFIHFSDYVRNALLAEYGGIWLDATLYLTEDLKGWNYPFYTIKQNRPADHVFVSEYRWTSFFLCGVKGNQLNSFVRDVFCSYIQKEQSLIDYLLLDYIIALGYETIPAIKSLIDNVPYSTPNLHYMQLDKPVDVDRLNEVCKDTFVFKLTYKIAVPEDRRSLYYYLGFGNC